jgi:GT2 family glycosyltransferase
VLDCSNVSIVIVSFRSEEALSNLLPSIPLECEIIIVNNDSPLPKKIKEIRNFFEIINSENKGFGSACNIGVKAAKKDYVFIVNPDTVFENNTIIKLLELSEKLPEASAFTPKILNQKNSESFKRRSILLDKNKWLKIPPSKISEIPVMGGAAIFIKKEIFTRVGGFDERIFLYHEDDDLSLRLKNEIGPLIYCPDISIIHIGGNSSSRSPEIAKLKGFHMGRSRVYAMKKHMIKNYRFKCLFLALIQLFSLQMLFSKRKRFKYFAFYQGVLRGLNEN